MNRGWVPYLSAAAVVVGFVGVLAVLEHWIPLLAEWVMELMR